MNRLTEASTWAGLGLVCHAVSVLIATKGADGAAWGQLFAGIAAGVIREKAV
jgi:hypothetical protein